MRKKSSRKPTTRAAKLVEKISENLGSGEPMKPLKVIMMEVGFSESYADSGQIKKTKTWQEIMDEYLPEEKLAKVTHEAMASYTIDSRRFALSLSDEEMKEIVESIHGCKVKAIVHGDQSNLVYYYVPDNRVRLAAAEMAARLRGSFAPDKIKIVKPYEEMSDADLEKNLQEINQQLSKSKQSKKATSDALEESDLA